MDDFANDKKDRSRHSSFGKSIFLLKLCLVL